ncbi:MAG: OsmC family protein [Beijerinckiaceae bacterium]
MQIRSKPFGPFVVSQDGEARHFQSQAGYSGAVLRASGDGGMSPADFLLGAVASCLSISLAMAAQQLKLDPGRSVVTASMRKADDLPNRFAQYDVTIAVERLPDADTCAVLAKRTKDICTVSQSLSGTVNLSLVALADAAP